MDYQGRGAQDGHVDQVQVQCRFMSTELETMTIRDGEPRTATSTKFKFSVALCPQS